MPFREKAKNLFRRKASTTDSSLADTASSSSSRERWPSNVYKPGETMPRPKYRKAPSKEHKEALESFNFGDSWRKKSFQSTYSPMGTRAPSRRNSLFSRKSYARSSRANSVSSVRSEKGGVRQREMHSGVALAPMLSTEVEAEGDDDVHNVGLSRVQSRELNAAKSRPRTAAEMPPSDNYFGTITAHDHQPFSEHDLNLAMQRSHLAVPT
ncbi:hypothetical protein LTR53_015321 [Teratosphaeriaceae sp. CCFEE 6253]|nr:hypothetical protein LTR53_015321 [Teratosphaeriaceae sp. CCFEE 6253]